jgi:hypothetical protein
VAETEQRFILYARSRKAARIIGYPAGLGLLAAAFFGPFGDTSGDWFFLRPVCGIFGLMILLFTCSVDRRRRIEVTEWQVTVVNTFSRYIVAWHELSDIEVEEIKAEGGWTAYHRLAFVTPSRRIAAEAPAGSRDAMMKVRDRILHARELSPKEPQSDVGLAVEGAAAVADRFRDRFPRLTGALLFTVLVLALAFTVVFVIGPIIVLVLDLILGDWLVDHVPFWDELVGFYEYLSG